MGEIGRVLLLIGIALVAAGLLFLLASRLGITRLPGDFVIRRGNVSCFFPLATSLLLSILLTLIFWLFRRG